MNFWKTLAAILAAVALIMFGSQATGYNLYTGDELQSHAGARIQQQLELDTGR